MPYGRLGNCHRRAGARLEDVLDALQGDGDDAGVGAGEEVAEGLVWRPPAPACGSARARPPEVALLMAQAASFLMSNSASLSMCTSGTTRSARAPAQRVSTCSPTSSGCTYRGATRCPACGMHALA